VRGGGDEQRTYCWHYKVQIENTSDTPVQLLSRWFQMVDANGRRDYLHGRGVLRQHPLLTPAERTFQFLSVVTLGTPRGLMGGNFTFAPVLPNGERGRPLVCEVPTFELEAPEYDPELDVANAGGEE
jgi:uncharacterized protein affecting Mg2+/Co2+ transport